MADDGKWIRFEETEPSPSGKTRRWRVVNKQHAATVGFVLWFSGWRRYVFEPCVGAVFEQDCLRGIAAFIEARTAEHKGGQSCVSRK